MDRVRERTLFVIFFLAGAPALIYQVAWHRVLKLYFGVDIYSTAIIVSTFLLGLGLGALIGGVLADRSRRPGFWYALVEMAMGGFGMISLPLFAAVGSALAGTSLGWMIAADFLLLLIPTSLMGMTMPLMCRAVIHDDARLGRKLAGLYAVNTLGAAAGAVLTCYILIGPLGLDGTTWLAAGLNVGLAFIMLGVGNTAGRGAASPAVVEPQPARRAVRNDASEPGLSYRGVLIAAMASGAIALGFEVIWYRVIGCLLHGTVYVFGTLLFFYLLGLGAGSLAAQRSIDKPGAATRFAWAQIGIGVYSLILFCVIGYLSWLPGLRHALVASTLLSFHPAPELVAGRVNAVTLYSAFDLIGWNMLILFVPTFLMGYGFPNLIRAGSRSVQQLGNSLGGIYFANIVGSAVGSLAVGFVGVEFLGTEHTLRVLIVAAIAVGAITLWRAAPDRVRAMGISLPRRTAAGGALALMCVAALVFPGATRILRAIHAADQPGVEFTVHEDRTGVVALRMQTRQIAFGQEDRIINRWRLLIDGASHGSLDHGLDEAGSEVELVAALAAVESPRRVLCIGLGDGMICNAAVADERVEEVVIVELNSGLKDMLCRTEQGRAIFDSGKVRFVVDDGRRWLLANPAEAFDVITMFPLHAAHAGSGTLYSAEFARLLHQRLTPGGLLYSRTQDLYCSARTLAVEFPHVLRVDRSVYLASDREFTFDADRLPAGFEIAARVTADRDLILHSTAGARINGDLRPNSEYYLTYPYARYLATLDRDPLPFSLAAVGRAAPISMRGGASAIASATTVRRVPPRAGAGGMNLGFVGPSTAWPGIAAHLVSQIPTAADDLLSRIAAARSR
ncbi:MAG: fused MFS/spermidine synthase [Phycisphaerales bacterium]|nr:fused MFS/spermidine synthase [Phycisphaerales bacterium]